MKIKLGLQVTDIYTGFKGIVTGKCEYINGCVQYLVQPKADKSGNYRDSVWIDEQRLKASAQPISKNIALTLPDSDAGGPQSNAPSTIYRG